MAVNSTVFVVAGEPSGDQLGAGLMAALSSTNNNRIRFTGIGGEEMVSQGFTSLFPMAELSVMGLVEVVPRIPLLLRRIKQTADSINRLQPAAIVTIDSPGFNFRMVRKLGKTNVPIIHYVAPTVWAWRPKRAKEMARMFDHLMVLLPFERKYFEKEGLACTFVGHPAAKHKDSHSGERFRVKYCLSGSTILGVFPGSRISEIQRMLPVFTDTVRLLQGSIPNLHILITIVSGTKNIIEKYIHNFSVPVTLVENRMEKRAAFQACNIALATSGTITTELAAVGTPMVVGYKMAPVTMAIARRVVKIPHITLINLLLGKEVVPEFIQGCCTPMALAEALRTLISDPRARSLQLERLKDGIHLLGGNGIDPAERAAKVVEAAIQKPTPMKAHPPGK